MLEGWKGIGTAAVAGAGITALVRSDFVQQNETVAEYAYAIPLGLGAGAYLLRNKAPRVAVAMAVIAGQQLVENWDRIFGDEQRPANPETDATGYRRDSGAIYDAGAAPAFMPGPAYVQPPPVYWYPPANEAGRVDQAAPDAGRVDQASPDAGAIYGRSPFNGDPGLAQLLYRPAA